MEFICKRIARGEETKLEDMIFAEKLAKANRSAGEMLRKARRLAASDNAIEDSLDNFLNQMDIGDPDPQNHRKGFDSPEDVIDFFIQDKTDDWRQRD